MTNLSLAETRVNDDPKFSKMLDALQANILKGHGRRFAHHLFFQFEQNKSGEIKNWIREFAKKSITSAAAQLSGSKLFNDGKTADAGPILTLSLSSSAYDILGLGASKPINPSFNNGMRGSSALLRDDASKYDQALKKPLHMLIIVADDDKIKAKELADKITVETSPFTKLLLNQSGNVLKTKDGTGIEHFGYADGISQPLYLEKDINKQVSTNEWNDSTPLNLLLKEDPGALNTDSFGSFLVFRKLEQNVKGFKNQEKSGLPVVKDVDGNENEENELAGAMLVGRFENGVPVVKSSIDNASNPHAPTNDFDYRNDLQANKCPFHSHIRLMNPRNGDQEARGDLKSHRITRRGIPYDDVNRIPSTEIENITDKLLDDNQPEAGVGLLFMCYQSNISDQFEILQAFWANQGNIGGHMVGEDSLISQGPNAKKTLPAQWGAPSQTLPFSFGNFVTNKGGEYFFTPSISFLKSL